jgi:hypothetical protein
MLLNTKKEQYIVFVMGRMVHKSRTNRKMRFDFAEHIAEPYIIM